MAAPGHTAGSIAVHLPQYGILFTGDTIASVGAVMLGVFNQDRDQTIGSFRRLATRCASGTASRSSPAPQRSSRTLPRGCERFGIGVGALAGR